MRVASIQLSGDLRTLSFYLVYELKLRMINSYEHVMLVGAASDETSACLFFRIEPAAMMARLVTIGRAHGKALSTPTPSQSPLEAGGVIHIDTYTDSPPTWDGVHIKSTSTCILASSTSSKHQQCKAILHRHVLLR
jgi:hypothetical protein